MYMRSAYALLGLAFLIVLVGAYLLFERAEAHTDTTPIVETSQ